MFRKCTIHFVSFTHEQMLSELMAIHRSLCPLSRISSVLAVSSINFSSKRPSTLSKFMAGDPSEVGGESDLVECAEVLGTAVPVCMAFLRPGGLSKRLTSWVPRMWRLSSVVRSSHCSSVLHPGHMPMVGRICESSPEL